MVTIEQLMAHWPPEARACSRSRALQVSRWSHSLRHIGAFGEPVLDALLVLYELQLRIFGLRARIGNL